ncbi:hypothetical protein KC19_3G167200 [Ceratodon purpureus]|uniref:Homeobox domain-containing protein n=1 Tax=Ceratodon purpureus TaxID=3225 RepID=A0A8T0IJA3_CERPU|nr:hypothetical protein KC19_3G167200 [Ceratodon purpureus]
MEVDGTVFERLAKSEIVMEDDTGEEEEVVVVEEEEEEEEKVEGSEGDGKLMQSLSEEIKVEGESDAAVVLNRLEMQSKLVNSHVEELQRIVSLQCRLTGANPLAQELASAILGTKEGKLGSSLSPETLKYLHAVFAVKDTLTKKEARDLGLISGATLTQVRDFFAMQRSRVRAFVQQFTDEAEPRSGEIGDEQLDQILGKDIGFSKLTDVDSVESLLEKMRQEKLFTQQEKLLQIILRTEQGLILRRFLEKGGLKVLCAWLIVAAADEQTTLLRQLLHVLSHLPMSCAIPLQVSSLLQPVNKLRFYFVQDVANHARILMSKWSNLFMNKVEGVPSVDSGGLGPISKDNLDVPRRVLKRERDPTVIMKRSEGGLSKIKTAEPLKGQFDLSRASVRPLPSGEIMKIPVLALAATKPSGHIPRPKSDFKSTTVGDVSPNYNTSKIKAVAAMQRNFRKIVPSKGARQPQTSIKPRLSETAVMDEIAIAQAPGVGARDPLSGPSSSTNFKTSQTPKARGAFTTDEGSKVKGAAKVAAAMSNIRSSSTFPVSEAANFATPVSRKHSLGDQQKERRKVLPVEDLGNGNRWRESTARRPVIEVGKTSRPLSADEIRKAKLRARIMQLPTAGTSGHKSTSAQDPFSSRGKPTPVGDGWSLDRYASMDGGDKPTQDGGGVLLPRPTTSNVDTTSVPKQVLDEKTFDQLLTEQAAEAKAAEAKAAEAKAAEAKEANAPDFEQAISPQISPIRENTLEQGSESTGHVSLPENDSNPDVDTNFQQATAIDVDSQPLSPSIAVALCDNFSETEDEVAEDIGVVNDPINTSPENPVVDTPAEDTVMEQAPMESECLEVIPSEPASDKVIEACLIPWVVPSVLNLNPAWGVVAGDASKELGFQASRVKREEEEIYPDLLSIPDNPKDLWDEEPLYDDTLTPEIPIEALEISSSKASSPTAVVNQVVEYSPLTNGTLPAAKIPGEPHVASTNAYGGAQQIGDAASGHDPNLLALLLSNPHLVSQLASQKGDGSLAGLSALLALGSVASQAAPTQAQILSQPTNNSNLPAAVQPQDQVANKGTYQGGQPLSNPFTETNAEPVRMVEETSIAQVPSWDASNWALPTPPASSITGSAMPSQGSNQPPPHGSVPQEFVSVGPPAYNGSFQKLPNAPYTWAPLNTLMHTSPKLFDPSLGRGRLPVMSHNVNGASGMPAADIVDDATVSSSGVPPPVYGQVGAPFNSVQGWPPPHGNNANHHQPVNVVNHHNVVPHAANSHSAQGNVNSSWAHSEQTGLPDYQHRRLPEPPLWARPPQIPNSSSLPAPPLPPYPPQPHSHSSNQYWQPQEPPNSFRPSPSPSHLPPFRQDCRPHHPSAPWHPNGTNYGHNQR